MAEKKYVEVNKLLDKVTCLKHGENNRMSADKKDWYVSEWDINHIPAADAVEVRHGEWFCWDYHENTWRCTACDGLWSLLEGTPKNNDMDYCPMCGAKMDGKDGDR